MAPAERRGHRCVPAPDPPAPAGTSRATRRPPPRQQTTSFRRSTAAARPGPAPDAVLQLSPAARRQRGRKDHAAPLPSPPPPRLRRAAVLSGSVPFFRSRRSLRPRLGPTPRLPNLSPQPRYKMALPRTFWSAAARHRRHQKRGGAARGRAAQRHPAPPPGSSRRGARGLSASVLRRRGSPVRHARL